MFILRAKNTLQNHIRMKKTLLVCSLLVGLVMSSFQSGAQSLDLFQPANPPILTPDVCQCDSLDLNYSILVNDFSFGTQFTIEISTDDNDWTISDTLPIVEFSPAAGPTDTITVGAKIATVIIPCDRASGNNYFRVIADDPNLGSDVISDTIVYLVNSRPTSMIDSIQGGFENPYTGANDWAFCRYDSVILYANQVPGGFYQWTVGGIDIAGANDTFYVVKNAGNYALKTRFGPTGSCITTSPDTVISTALPPTQVSLKLPAPNVFQIDNNFVFDSIRFCETETATLQGRSDPTGVLTFKYQWLTDSIGQFGDRFYYPTDVGDTNRELVVDTTGLYYLVIDDGLCIDTSDAYHVFVDTIPRTKLTQVLFSHQTGAPSPFDACMKLSDSVMLGTTSAGIDWKYQWQRLNTSLNAWQDLGGETNPNIIIDTARFPPVQYLSYYRLRIHVETDDGFQTCMFFTDSMRIRWFEDYTIDYTVQPFVYPVGQDSVSFCETDSVELIAPMSPLQFQLIYNYQWLTDSIDSLGVSHIVAIPGATNRTVTTDSAGRYYVVIDDGICLDTSRFFRVFVDTLPRTQLANVPWPGSTSATLNLCYYDSTLLSAVDTVVPGWDYQWVRRTKSTPWALLPGDTTPILTVDTSHKPVDDTVYYRLITAYENQFGLTICPHVTDSIEVIFFASPNVSFFPGDSNGLCIGDSVLVVAQGNALSYSWENGAVLGSSIWLDSPGLYALEATGVNGCITRDTVEIFSLSTTADAGPNVTVNSGEIAVLTGSGGASYRWFASKPLDFNDYLSQTIQVSKTLEPGVVADTIVVYMIATGISGCDGLDSLILIINNPAGPEIPNLENTYNLFTPNDDGLNDVWDITQIMGEDACKIQILNRWGSVVFEDDTFSGMWDGTDEGGNLLPDGTYYYILSCNDEVRIKSAVTIIRNQ